MMNKKVKTRTLENRKGAAPKQALSYRLSLVIRFGDKLFSRQDWAKWRRLLIYISLVDKWCCCDA